MSYRIYAYGECAHCGLLIAEHALYCSECTRKADALRERWAEDSDAADGEGE